MGIHFFLAHLHENSIALPTTSAARHPAKSMITYVSVKHNKSGELTWRARKMVIHTISQ
jgi:hypothetical protein